MKITLKKVISMIETGSFEPSNRSEVYRALFRILSVDNLNKETEKLSDRIIKPSKITRDNAGEILQRFYKENDNLLIRRIKYETSFIGNIMRKLKRLESITMDIEIDVPEPEKKGLIRAWGLRPVNSAKDLMDCLQQPAEPDKMNSLVFVHPLRSAKKKNKTKKIGYPDHYVERKLGEHVTMASPPGWPVNSCTMATCRMIVSDRLKGESS